MNTAGVRGANSHQNQKSKYNLESALSICGSSTSADSTNPRSSGSIVFTTGKKKNRHTSGSVQLKSKLLKDQLYLNEVLGGEEKDVNINQT